MLGVRWDNYVRWKQFEPLLELFDRLEEDDWVHEELPVVFGLIGPAAFPALAAYLADLSHTASARISAMRSIEEIAERWPNARGEALAMLKAPVGTL